MRLKRERERMTWPHETLVLVSLGGPWRHPRSGDVLQPVSFPTVSSQSLLFAPAASSCIAVSRMSQRWGSHPAPRKGTFGAKSHKGGSLEIRDYFPGEAKYTCQTKHYMEAELPDTQQRGQTSEIPLELRGSI